MSKLDRIAMICEGVKVSKNVFAGPTIQVRQVQFRQVSIYMFLFLSGYSLTR